MTGKQDGKDASRYRDAGFSEALLRLGPDAEAAHPGVLADRGGGWVHVAGLVPSRALPAALPVS